MAKMVISDNCVRCNNSKRLLSEIDRLDQVELVDISTKEGQELAIAHKLRMAGSDIIASTDEERELFKADKISVSDYITLYKEV